MCIRDRRCPGMGTCAEVPPYRIWVVRSPDGASTFTPRALTQDSTFLRFGSLNWYSFDYLQPRWDPTATNPRARIAFLSELGGAGLDLWTAELVDRPPFDARRETLESVHRLTRAGGYSACDGHPEGTKLCALGPSGLSWVDAM